MSTTYFTIPIRRLTTEQKWCWNAIQREANECASPYFRAEFAQAVGSSRNDVYVTLILNEGRTVGFFPFQRHAWGKTARPVGLRMSDYHGVIAEPTATWDVETLLTASGVVRWEFDHVPVTQDRFSAWMEEHSQSPIVDLSGGYSAFRANCSKAARKQIRETERKAEKLAAEHAPVRFVLHTESLEVLNTLMSWKSAQCLESGVVDFFGLPWCREVLQHLLQSRESDFGLQLSCLYCGETLIAAHAALITDSVWHSWFPAYSRDYAPYSPGSILLVHLLEAGGKQGIRYLDFGKDVSMYKRHLMTGAIEVAEGRVELPSLINQALRLRIRCEQWVRGSRFEVLARHPGRLLKRIERMRRYD